MLNLPLNPRFVQAVLTGVKRTTIRQTPWPIGVPIRLYCWEGRPYASRQLDAAVIVVKATQPLYVSHDAAGVMHYSSTSPLPRGPLHVSEGFNTRAEMDAWFRKVVPQQLVGQLFLMRFRLAPENRSPIARKTARKLSEKPQDMSQRDHLLK